MRTTGEGLTLDGDERERLIRIAMDETAGRIRVFLGISGSDTRKVAMAVDSAGHPSVDGYLVTCPNYTRPSKEGLFRHFEAVAGSTDRPVLIYNIPYRTSVNIANETLLALAEIPNIVGLKDCCADTEQSFDLLDRRPAGFSVLTGEDAFLFCLSAWSGWRDPRIRTCRDRSLRRDSRWPQ